MCGIIGYTGKEQAFPFLEKGLKKLEYRGYDSVGVATLEKGISLVKRQGRVEDLLGNASAPVGTCGIGHTRWATHGKPNRLNAHPHRMGRFALVHNGILENYRELKQFLTQRGVRFQSETDTEVIVALFSLFDEGDLLSTAKRVFPRLTGSYALAVLREGEKGHIFVCAKGSPLIVGRSKEGYFVASDRPALSSFVEESVALSDGESALLSKESVRFFDADFSEVKKSYSPFTLSAEETDKGAFSSFMEKEIAEIPAAVQRTLKNMEQIPSGIRNTLLHADRLVFVACGTAYHSCLVAKYLSEKLLRVPTECFMASEFRYGDPILSERTAVFAVSQSGETADTLVCAKMVRERGIPLIGVTNVSESSLTRIAEQYFMTAAGVEIGVAATKSYNAQLACFYALFFSLAEVNRGELLRVPRWEEEVLAQSERELDHLARLCAEAKSIFFLGRGIDYYVALEAALKMKEITYRFAEGYAAGELKHGTLALVDADSIVIAFFTQSALNDKMENAVAQVASRGAKVAVITSEKGYTEAEFCQKYGVRESILLPQGEIFSPLLAIIPVQRLVSKVARLLSLDPDKPRNLAKSVTVE